MKNVDLHIHTSPTVSDRDFEFNRDEFQRNAGEGKLDAVAITKKTASTRNWSHFPTALKTSSGSFFNVVDLTDEGGGKPA